MQNTSTTERFDDIVIYFSALLLASDHHKGNRFVSYEDIIPSFIPLLLATWKPIKHFRRVKSSSLPWCCALSWRGGLRALVTMRAMMAGAYAPGR